MKESQKILHIRSVSEWANADTLSMKKTDYLRKLGANIRRIRESKGLSQDKVCLEGELSRATMSRIEAGSVDVQAWTLYRVAMSIGVPVSKLTAVKN